MKFTVLGGHGFIGRSVVAECRARGFEVDVPARGERPVAAKNLGHVIYAIGLTADFRWRPFDTVDAHVGLLGEWLQRSEHESFLYLSSTRVYGRLPAGEVAAEDASLSVAPSLDSLYDLSKLLGEALCLSRDKHSVRIARLSNIYGRGMSENTFVGSILRDLRKNGQVTIGEDPQSSKDYLHVDDAARLLVEIALKGQARAYNVASGSPTTHQAIASRLSSLHGLEISFAEQGPKRTFPAIDTTRISSEFSIIPRKLTDDIGDLWMGVAAKPEKEDLA